jgi:predicted transposase/invertase (TIGR01784 family)
MPDNNINREYKDTLFRLIFGEHKKYALALYNAVNHTDYTDESELVVKTLRDALYVDVKNDVGYVFHDIMNLIEHQASFNPNMPLRGLGYFADMYKEYISEAFRASSVLYSEKLVHLPTPRYFVLYNGIREMQDDLDLKLSDAYDNKGDIEVIAHMLNINKGHNKTLLEACRPLKDYAELIDRIRGQKAQGCTNEEAVSTAMNSCIEDGVLEEFLRKERDKVENILIRGLTEEEKKEVERINQEYYKEQGIEQGLVEGRTLTKLEDVDKLVASGVLDPIKACEILGVSYDEYKNRPDQ